MLSPTLEQMKKLGYAVFENGLYNLNIVGIRSKNRKAGSYDDRIELHYQDETSWVCRSWRATVDPGDYYLRNPMNSDGAAILKPGQYRGAYIIGPHGQTGYTALVQRGGEVDVYRDNDRDLMLEPVGPLDTGYFGINIHSPGRYQEEIGKSSAGCQVFARHEYFEEFMKIVFKSAEIYGERFTYTLLEQWW